MKACGLRGPRVALRRLTDEQRQCLADQGVTPPGALGRRHPAAAERRGSATPSARRRWRVDSPSAAIATAAGTIRSDDRIALAGSVLARLRVAHVEPPARQLLPSR